MVNVWLSIPYKLINSHKRPLIHEHRNKWTLQMLDDDLLAALERMHLSPGPAPASEALTGGVSSDIWRVDLPSGSICIKRARAKLKVSAIWQAPVERNIYEARWMQAAARAAPGAAPELLGQDPETGSLAMAYLPPEHFPLWKNLLRDGSVNLSFSAQVGATLGRIHAATASDSAVAGAFPTDHIFYEIRLEPYLDYTGRVHPDLQSRLQSLISTTLQQKHALVHGDVSPKNILCGPQGPVFLDAECAWWGDPAFDLAFCLNHLLLKCIWVPRCTDAYLAAFHALATAYLSEVAWEAPSDLEARAAHLLPALLLARVDGKSPVEYITAAEDKDRVRTVGRRLLLDPCDRLSQVALIWQQEATA